jgi:hypothetical protein
MKYEYIIQDLGQLKGLLDFELKRLCSIIGLRYHSNTSLDPMSVGVLTLHGQASHHDEIVGDSDSGQDTLTL